MQNRFDYFVVFAEMRTGSNFLEANLNAHGCLRCHGEAFNPHFIGYPNKSEIQGVTLAMREADPDRLIDAIKGQSDGLGGFRFFHDHDPRALAKCLEDPRCAKIILTRNPLESYISWKIAQETGQWKLTDVARRKDAKAVFDSAEFERHLASAQAFQKLLRSALQVSGQTAFYLDFEDLQDLNVINGVIRFLGQSEGLKSLDKSLKRQNPTALKDKVANYEQMVESLARRDGFGLHHTPIVEPGRGPAVKGHIAATRAPLLFMPIKSAPNMTIQAWLSALDDASAEDLMSDFNQKTLRQWKRQHRGHRSFTVLRHPVARAHEAFCQYILNPGPECYADIRATLRRVYKLPVPESMPDKNYDRRSHQTAFLAFLAFLKSNLSGQTGIRVDPAWATQTALLQGMAQFTLPDFVFREDEIYAQLPELAGQLGYQSAPQPMRAEGTKPFSLADIYDGSVEEMAADVYQRDYMMFGFGAWAR